MLVGSIAVATTRNQIRVAPRVDNTATHLAFDVSESHRVVVDVKRCRLQIQATMPTTLGTMGIVIFLQNFLTLRLGKARSTHQLDISVIFLPVIRTAASNVLSIKLNVLSIKSATSAPHPGHFVLCPGNEQF